MTGKCFLRVFGLSLDSSEPSLAKVIHLVLTQSTFPFVDGIFVPYQNSLPSCAQLCAPGTCLVFPERRPRFLTGHVLLVSDLGGLMG